MKRAYGIAVTVFLAWGCAPGVVRTPGFRHPEFTTPCEVAVLPVINRTRDASLAPVVRGLLCDVLAAKGYRVLPPDWVDARLAEAGYGDPELALRAPREDLTGVLTTVVFVVGTLQSCDRTPIGFLEKRTVRLSAEIMDAATTYWRGSLTATRHALHAQDTTRQGMSRSHRGPVRRVRRVAGGVEPGRHSLQDDLAVAVSALLADIPGTDVRVIAW
jgi:hypothetical protein